MRISKNVLRIRDGQRRGRRRPSPFGRAPPAPQQLAMVSSAGQIRGLDGGGRTPNDLDKSGKHGCVVDAGSGGMAGCASGPRLRYRQLCGYKSETPEGASSLTTN